MNLPRCPNCGAFIHEGGGSGCPLCGYRGERIAHDHRHLFGCVEWRSGGLMDEVYLNDRDCVCHALAGRRGFRVIEGGRKP